VAGAGADVLLGRHLDTVAHDVRADPRPFAVVAAGKAAGRMLAALRDRLEAPCTRALLVVPSAPVAGEGEDTTVVIAGHPVPDAASVEAGRLALEIARQLGPGDRLIVLLSGGASALLAAPAAPVTLGDKVQLTRLLLKAGASIDELNAVRKHVSAVKGGRLAAATPAAVTTFALSDVVGPTEDDPSVIGSGPTVVDPTTFADALAVLARHGLRDRVPAAVVDLLARGARGQEPETPKQAEHLPAGSVWHLVGSRRAAMEAAATAARALGYRAAVVGPAVTGEARQAGPALLARARALAAEGGAPCCVVASGETTVRVTGRGRGGRNQELVLSTVTALAAAAGPFVVASVGTDGIDGPTDAAGAIADPTTLRRARASGAREPDACLSDNDAYTYFAAIGDLIKTGPTGTNVADLQVILIAERLEA
jgi:hydroxypyruvate reductase